MNADFFAALEQLEKEKGIPVEYMLDRVCQALQTAYKKDNDGLKLIDDDIHVEADAESRTINVYVTKEVVDEVEDPLTEVSLEEARSTNKLASLGDKVRVEVETKKFGRIAAQAAKQVIIQGIRESERGMVFNEYSSKEHEILSAVVNRIDPRNGNAILDMQSDGEKTEAILSANEQVANENLTEGQRIKVYVVEVRKGPRGPQVLISRTHPGLVKRLFELEVPEIHDGVVEVKSIAREAGSRTKIAVASNDENVDAIGACVGPRGSRVGAIVEELSGEKIDIIKYSDDMATFVSEALSPADVVKAIMLPDGKSCRVIVPDDQLSLAIGKEGQNARLAAKLTGCKIDIGPESQAAVQEQEEDEDLIAD